MATKVHVWMRTDKPEGPSVGHVSISVNRGAYISWWPKHPTHGPWVGWTLPSLQSDIAAQGFLPWTYELDNMAESDIIMWWFYFMQDNDDWDPVRKNCATVVYEALCVGDGWYNRFNALPVWWPAAIHSIVSKPRTQVNEAFISTLMEKSSAFL